MALKAILLITVLIGTSLAQQQSDFSEALDNLPEDLQGKIDQNKLEEIQSSSKKAFKEKCEKNGGPDAYVKFENATANMMVCLQSLVDKDVLEKEIEEAKPNGKVDEVFKKYCDKTPEFKNCFYTMTDAAKPCFEEKEQKNLNFVYNITEQLAEFICYKEGDRIALFISEGGPECFQEKRDEIMECANKTLGDNAQLFNTKDFTPTSLPSIEFDEEKCAKMVKLEKCMVSSLETCKQPTSANIVEALFKFVRKATPCKKFETVLVPVEPAYSRNMEAEKTTSASTSAVASATLLMAMSVAYLV